MGGVNHFFALAPSRRPSAPANSFSKGNRPIFACVSLTPGPRDSRFSAVGRNTPVAPSSSRVFHYAIWLRWTSNFYDGSAKVLSPLSTANSTFTLHAAVWFVLGLVIAAPPSGNCVAHQSRSFT